MDGWVKLHRALLKKPIWQLSTPEQKSILITLLLMANHEENKWEWNGQPYHCNPGQFVTSLESIANECGKGISVQNVRTALKRFEKYDFLTDESTKSGRLITIVNWDNYQLSECEANKDDNSHLTDGQQTANRRLTPNKNIKNDKNIIYKDIVEYLNEKAGTNYNPSTKATQTLINARLKEGRTVEDFKVVINKKVAEWKGNKDMEQYLRPQTLFGTKFESYLNQKEVKSPDQQYKKPQEQQPRQNKFNNHEQRVYTDDIYAALEKRAISKSVVDYEVGVSMDD